MDPVNRCADAGIFIGAKECWSRGYGTEAMSLLLDYGFAVLNLESVMLEVSSFNARAIRSYKKVGFREIGRRRQSRIIAGRRYDRILMGILAEEFSVEDQRSVGPV